MNVFDHKKLLKIFVEFGENLKLHGVGLGEQNNLQPGLKLGLKISFYLFLIVLMLPF